MISSEDALWLGVVTIAVALTWSYDLARAAHSFLVDLAPVARYANAREKMPPKSTYFYPKVPSGLLFNPL